VSSLASASFRWRLSSAFVADSRRIASAIGEKAKCKLCGIELDSLTVKATAKILAVNRWKETSWEVKLLIVLGGQTVDCQLKSVAREFIKHDQLR